MKKGRLKWHDTTERDGDIEDEPCRVIDCPSKHLWVIQSDGFEDVVCLFHMAAYVWAFIVATTGGPLAFEAQPLEQREKSEPVTLSFDPFRDAIAANDTQQLLDRLWQRMREATPPPRPDA